MAEEHWPAFAAILEQLLSLMLLVAPTSLTAQMQQKISYDTAARSPPPAHPVATSHSGQDRCILPAVDFDQIEVKIRHHGVSPECDVSCNRYGSMYWSRLTTEHPERRRLHSTPRSSSSPAHWLRCLLLLTFGLLPQTCSIKGEATRQSESITAVGFAGASEHVSGGCGWGSWDPTPVIIQLDSCFLGSIK